MQFKLKEREVLDFFEINFPNQKFENGRLLVGQDKQNDLSIYYLGEDFLGLILTNFKTFEHREAHELN